MNTNTTDPILKEGIDQLKIDMAKAHQIVHGDAETLVDTDNGPVRSFAKVVQDNQTKIDAFLPDVNSRELKSNGNASNGFPRLDGYKLPVVDPITLAKTFIVATGTQERTQTLQDKSGVIALKSDITGTNTGTNTGDETKPGLLTKLEIPSISGVNTGDQTLEQLGGQPKLTFTPVDAATLGKANGVATLDNTGKIPAVQLPSFVDDVLEVATEEALPTIGEGGKIYIAVDTNEQYRWSGTFYTKLMASPGSTDAVPEGGVNKYFTESRVLNTLLAGYTLGSNAVLTVADSVRSALGKLQKQIVDILPVLAAKANSESPTLTGIVSVPNLASDNSTQQAANTAFVQALVTSLYNRLLGGAAADVNTLAKLAAAIGNDPAHAATVNAMLAQRELLANKATSFANPNDTLYPTVRAVKEYADSLLTKVMVDCGGWNALQGTYPTVGGTGPSGSVLKGNLWFVSGDGKLGDETVSKGDSFRALVDNPGQDPDNWSILESNFNYVPVNKAGDNMKYLVLDDAGKALSFDSVTNLAKYLGIGNGTVQMDFGLESQVGGDLINGSSPYGVSLNTSGSTVNFGIQKKMVFSLSNTGGKLYTSAPGTTLGRNTVLSLKQTVAGAELNLELGDDTNPSVKFVYLAGELMFMVNGAVRAKFGLDGKFIVDDIERTDGNVFWHTGNMKPGQAGSVATLGADGKLFDAQVPTTDKVAEGLLNKYFTELRVLNTKLSGYVATPINAVLNSTDHVLFALAKLQRQILDITTRTTNTNTGDETQASITNKLGNTNNLPEGSSNLYFTPVRAVASALAGYATATVNAVVVATDTISQAIGKLQKQVTDLNSRTSNNNTGDETRETIVDKLGNTDNLPEGVTNTYFTMARAVGARLTGYTVAAANAVVVVTDTVSQAIGKLQKQISDLSARTTNTNTGDETRATILSKTGATALTGNNTGDETRATIVTKIGYDPVNPAQLGVANGIATLDSNGTVPASQLPSYVDDVLEFDTRSVFPAAGERGKIYIDIAENETYRWSGSTYIIITASPGTTDAVPEGASNKYFTEGRAIASKLAGYAVATVNAVVGTGDSILSAIGKLQKQISDLGARTTNTNTGDETKTTILTKLGASAVTGANSGDETQATIVSKLGNTDALPEGPTNQYFTIDRVRSTVLAGLSVASGTVVSATDTVLAAIGKLQRQASDLLASVNTLKANNTGTNTGDETQATITSKLGNTNNLPEGTTNWYFSHNRVRATLLDGFTVAVNTVVTAGDSVLSSIGKLQGQLNALLNRTTNTNTGDETQTTIFNKIGYTPLNPANVGNYAPTKTGTGASGTWGIDISGNAARSDNSAQLGGLPASRTMQKRRNRIHSDDGTSLNSSVTMGEYGFTYGGSGEPQGPFMHFGGLGQDGDYGCQMVADYNNGNIFMWRTRDSAQGVWNPWNTFWHTGNLQLSVGAAPSTVVQRNGLGHVLGNFINMSDDGTDGGNGNNTDVTGIIGKQGDNYYRTLSAAKIKKFLDIEGVTKSYVDSLLNAISNLANVVFSGFMAEKIVYITANTTTTTLDLSLGSVFKVTVAANTTINFDISKIPAAKLASAQLGFAVILVNDATEGRGVAFGSALLWTDQAAPQRTTAALARDDFYFYTDTGGAPYIASLTNQNVK